MKNEREKEGDVTQSYDKNPHTNKKKKTMDNTKTQPKTSISQRTDLGRSVGEIRVIQLAWLNRFTGTQPSH